jgi:regulator of protease activity HflC (stomatin/prohibitin superfamily)
VGWFIIGVILALIAVVCFIGPGLTSDEKSMGRVVGVVVAVIAAIFFALSGSYTQSTGETVLIRGAGGDVISVDSSPGFGWTAPWNKREKWDTRLQRIELAGNGDDVDGPAVPVPSLGNDASINVSLVYNIKGSEIEDLDNEHRDQSKLEDNRLRLALRDITATVGSGYDAFGISTQRADLQEELTELLKEELTEVDVERVEVGDINLPPTVRDALDRVNQRQAEVEEARASLDRARIEANTTRTEAQAQADADQIQRCGATTRTTTQEVAGEDVEVIEVVPVPNDQCQNRLNPQVLVSKWIDALERMGADGNLIVVPDDPSQILQLPVPETQGG